MNDKTEITAESLLTSYEVGEILQVNPSSINKWIKDGRIEAFRTPGGHRRIRVGDLVTFLDTHHMPVPESLRKAGKKRVLFVDDDQKQLDSLQRLAKQYAASAEVKTATNGVEAMVLVGSYKPHLVVLDVYMPNLDGIEVCSRLMANPETKNIKVILASGHLSPEIEQKALKAGAYRCVNKPINIQELMKEIGVRPSP
jgi:excisionase family DNA binding protein